MVKVIRFSMRNAQSKGQSSWLLPVLKQIVPLSLGLLCLWILAQRMAEMDMAHIATVFVQVSLGQWLAAAGATALSFWAVGRYDAVVHRHLRTGYGEKSAAIAGVSSIALAQTLGFGVFTGALARWRMMPDLGLAMATKISATVAVSFLAGWSVITALATLALDGPNIPLALLLAPLALLLVLVGAAFWRPHIAVLRWRFTLPSLTAIGAITALTLIDTAAAATALQILLPATLDIGFETLFPVFLIALGAALVSGTPGGVGPFELTMLALLPHVPAPDLIAAILAFRILYYAIPAVLALAVLARPPQLRPKQAPRSSHTAAQITAYQPRDSGALHHAARAELGLLRQGDAHLMQSTDCAAVVLDTGQSLTALFDPLYGTTSAALTTLKTLAKQSNRLYSLYKCSPRVALCARNHGLNLLHIADEALIDPSQFALNTPAYRQLRRKLRHAAKNAVRLEKVEPGAARPRHQLAAVDAAWIAHHGRARGATMGRFAPRYLADQRLYLAWQGETLIGFISLHIAQQELCLDLMRARPDAPDGTMHALVHAAIETAAKEGRTRLSLAALPAGTGHTRGLERLVRRQVLRFDRNAGLIQFKTCFKPRLQPLYAAAPSWLSLLLSLADLARLVHFPDDIPDDHSAKSATANPAHTPAHPLAHDDYDNYEIAPRPIL